MKVEALRNRVKALHAEGYGLYKISKILSNEGIKTPRGNTNWQEIQVRRLLNGEMTYKKSLPFLGKSVTIESKKKA